MPIHLERSLTPIIPRANFCGMSKIQPVVISYLIPVAPTN
jgi:hypothetical protein